MNIRVSKSNGGTAYVYGTMSNHATKAQMHHVMRNLYSEICEEYRCNDLTFQFDDYHVRIRSVKLQRERAEKVFQELCKTYNCEFDDRGNIGKRYRRQDEIGTPFCVTYDFDSEEDGAVTVRDRDTMEQERVKIEDLKAYFEKKFEF